MAVINQFNQMNQAQPSANTTQAGPMQPTKKPVGSGQFANINRIIGANAGAGQQYAQKLEQGAQKQQQTAEQNIQQAQSKFTGATGAVQTEQKNVSDTASQIADAVKNQSAASLMNNGQLNQNVANVITGTNQGNQIGQQFQQAASGIGSNLQQIQGTNQALQSEVGRGQLLRNVLARPGYGGGMAALDQSLLQTEGSKQLGALQQKTLQDYLSGTKTATDLSKTFGTELQGLNKAALDARTQLLGDEKGGGVLQQGVGSFKSAQEKEVAELNAKSLEEYNRVLAGLGNTSSLTDADLQNLGLSKGQQIFNVLKNAKDQNTLTNYLGRTDASFQNVIDENEYANYAALDKLLNVGGKGGAGLGLTGAGSLKDVGVSYKKDKLGQDISEAKENFFANLAGETFTGAGRHKWHTGSDSSFNRKDYDTKRQVSLTGQQLIDALNKSEAAKGKAYGAFGQEVDPYSTANSPGDIGKTVDNVVQTTIQNPFGAFLGSPGVASNIISDLFNTDKTQARESEAVKIATRQAQAQLEKKYKDYLEAQGYNTKI